MATKSKKATKISESKSTAGNGGVRKRTSKTDQLVKLLKPQSGCDIAALSSKLGWQQHSTRAALSKLRKTGYAVEKLPPKKGSNSRYRITSGPAGPA